MGSPAIVAGRDSCRSPLVEGRLAQPRQGCGLQTPVIGATGHTHELTFRPAGHNNTRVPNRDAARFRSLFVRAADSLPALEWPRPGEAILGGHLSGYLHRKCGTSVGLRSDLFRCRWRCCSER